MAAREHDIITADGARIHVREDGNPSAPAITFGHSLAASGDMWEPQITRLADRFRLVRIDFRGHGGSSIAPAPEDFADLARDTVAVWDGLGIARSHYVGLSLGGIAAAWLGSDHADRVDRLVIADCRFDAPYAYRALWRRRLELLDAQGMAAIADDTLPSWLTRAQLEADPIMAARLHAGIVATPADGWRGIVKLFPSLDAKKRLTRIAVPTLLLCGGEDPVCDEMAECAALVPGGRFAIVDGAAHVANIGKPDAFTAELVQFLTQ